MKSYHIFIITLLIIYILYRVYLKIKFCKHESVANQEQKALDEENNKAMKNRKKPEIIPWSWFSRSTSQLNDAYRGMDKVKYKEYKIVKISEFVISLLAFAQLLTGVNDNAIFFGVIVLSLQLCNILFEFFYPN